MAKSVEKTQQKVSLIDLWIQTWWEGVSLSFKIEFFKLYELPGKDGFAPYSELSEKTLFYVRDYARRKFKNEFDILVLRGWA